MRDVTGRRRFDSSSREGDIAYGELSDVLAAPTT
jgi:hypothetical protein